MMAAHFGRLDIARVLIDAGADVNMEVEVSTVHCKVSAVSAHYNIS
jgi:hypothetical protein